MSYKTVQEYIDDQNTTGAERNLIAACQAGRECFLPDNTEENATQPTDGEPQDNRHIRAELLRVLILGGTPDCRLHPIGVKVAGASITGLLDLSHSKARGRCELVNCHFDQAPRFVQAQFANLSLAGSHLPGLLAQRINVEGSASFGELISMGTVDVNGGEFGGRLDFTKAILKGDNGVALKAYHVTTKQSLILEGTVANGTVILGGAKIGGQLDCEDATFDGAGFWAIDAQRLFVANGFFFRKIKLVNGLVYLFAAHVGDLKDDAESVSKMEDALVLNGFSYEHIGEHAPLTLAGRKDWLTRGSRYESTFHPQPYTQFANTLRRMGHASEARKVLMARDGLLFDEAHKTNLTALNAARDGLGLDIGVAWLRYYLLRLWSWFTRNAVGYGHAPQRALFWSMACVLFGAVWFFIAWAAGAMVPSSDVILNSPDWLAAMTSNPNAPSHDWASLPPGIHYETFYALPYALDIFVPFVSLGQEQAWAATTTSTFGILTRWFTFIYQFAGWALTALGVAAVTGFVQKNQPD